jgi:hypothetical protein
MGQVNSHGERWLSERHARPALVPEGEQPRAQNGGIPGLVRVDLYTKRLLPRGVLAEGERLWSNTLNVTFQWVTESHSI